MALYTFWIKQKCCRDGGRQSLIDVDGESFNDVVRCINHELRLLDDPKNSGGNVYVLCPLGAVWKGKISAGGIMTVSDRFCHYGSGSRIWIDGREWISVNKRVYNTNKIGGDV